MIARVLAIGGSDPGGGAGIQADIKTITALGGYAAAVVTAVTVQDTLGVSAVHSLPPALVVAQIRAVLDDIGADAVKIGMLGDAAVVEAVADALEAFGGPVVIDPVMAAKGGAALMGAAGLDTLKARLIPRCAVLTPNAPEAEALTGLTVHTTGDLRRAGHALLALGCGAVVMKGGHVDGGDVVTDLVLTTGSETALSGERVKTRHSHGTGCTLASAIALGLAEGLMVDQAAARARAYVVEAMARAPGFGGGHGPMDHGWPLRDVLL